MYTIGNIVYGVKPSEKTIELIDRLGIGPDDVGLLTWYSGSASTTPCAIGIEIKSIDEIEDVNLDELVDSIPHSVVEEYGEYLENFKKELSDKFFNEDLTERERVYVEDFKKSIKEDMEKSPNLWIIWSTS